MNVKSSYRYEGFAADGEGILCISDMDYWKNSQKLTQAAGITFEIGEGITEVEEGFFDLIPSLIRINFPKSLKKLNMSDSTLELFRRNRVMISGCFDSYAESFAMQNKLSFIHSDIELARAGDYHSPGGKDIVTLRFMNDGRAMLFQECFSQGSSAGSSGGGEDNIELKANFYKTLSENDLADMCWGTCSGKVRQNRELAVFLKKARQKDGYYLCFNK